MDPLTCGSKQVFDQYEVGPLHVACPKWDLRKFPILRLRIKFVSIMHSQPEPFPGQNLFWTHAIKFFKSESENVKITDRNIVKLAKKAAIQYVAAIPVKRADDSS